MRCAAHRIHSDLLPSRPAPARQITIPDAKDGDLARKPEGAIGSSFGCSMHRRTALKIPLLVAAATAASRVPRAAAEPGRWSAERANTWYQSQGWPVGANYITSTAINQIEMFQGGTYDPRRIDDELRVARVYGLNSVRVFLPDLLWVQDRISFQRRLAQFVSIAASRGIKPLFVFFDSCWDPFPKLGPQKAPTPGVHNSGWVQSPGAERLGDRSYLATMQDYVVGVMTQFRNDDRVLGWDLWNEPDNPAPQYRKVERADKQELVAALLPQVFQWARSVDAVQPVTSGVWQGTWKDPARRSEIASIQLDNSDVISFHSYDDPAGFEARIGELAPLGRPILCTEYLARPKGSTIEGVLPVAKRLDVGAFNWGLVAGKTQTYLPWDSWEHPYTAPPKLWFHDLLQPDGSAYRGSEFQAVQKLAGGVRPV